jgi:Uma2 family endonuclease
VEVLSDSTEDYDRSKKFLFYRALPSFNEYLLIRQDKPFVEYYAKLAEHKWLLTEVEGLSAKVSSQTSWHHHSAEQNLCEC